MHSAWQVLVGDVSTKNLWLCRELVKLLQTHRAWLNNHKFLLCVVVITLLRLIPDHCPRTQLKELKELQNSEISLAIDILRSNFDDCMAIGRDLMRLLADVSRIPEFEQLWHTLLGRPQQLSANLTDISQLLKTRTHRKYLITRLTAEMESQLFFMMSQVKMGNQKRYQQWFMAKHMPTPELESLVPDLIRYLVSVTPSTVQVDVVPRWAVAGWLLQSVTSATIKANVKLALLYDWLFFDKKSDSIMNIEPAMLLMKYSIPPHANSPKYAEITATLLEFLFLVRDKFDASRSDVISAGIRHTAEHLVKMRVIDTWADISTCPHLDVKLRAQLRKLFHGLCHGDPEDLRPKPLALAVNDDGAPSGIATSPTATSPTASIGRGSSADSDDDPPSDARAKATRTELAKLGEMPAASAAALIARAVGEVTNLINFSFLHMSVVIACHKHISYYIGG